LTLPSQGNAKFEDFKFYNPNIKSELNGEDDWQGVLTPATNPKAEKVELPAKKKDWLGGNWGASHAARGIR